MTRGSRRAGALATGAVLVLAALALAGAGGGRADLGAPRWSAVPPLAAQGFGDLADVEPAEPADDPPRPDEPGTPWALVVLGVLGTAAAAVMIRSLRPGPRQLPDEPEPPPEQRSESDTAPPALAALRRAARTGALRLGAVGPGRARDAVVACWLELEQAAAAGGSRRHPAQTPTEFTTALLARHAADPEATARLLRLYHRARFGSAPLDDAAADEAAQCLRRIAATLAAGGARASR
jgi:hypothetical protein